MAILHNKEHKIATVIEKLPKKYTEDQFVEQFIKLFSKEWGKIKSAYIKQSQDKEQGTVINMPKPDLYLKQLLKNFLKQENEQPIKTKELDPNSHNEATKEEIVKVVKKTELEKIAIKEKIKVVKKPEKAAAEKVSKQKK